MATGRGIIPALAGNTYTKAPHRRAGPEHPRSRGEYNGKSVMYKPELGSSPLSRGIRFLEF